MVRCVVSLFSSALLCLSLSVLSSLDVPVERPSAQERTKVVLAELLGDLIWKEISEAIIKDCLVYSIPTNSSKLEQYEEVCVFFLIVCLSILLWLLISLVL